MIKQLAEHLNMTPKALENELRGPETTNVFNNIINIGSLVFDHIPFVIDNNAFNKLYTSLKANKILYKNEHTYVPNDERYMSTPSDCNLAYCMSDTMSGYMYLMYDMLVPGNDDIDDSYKYMHICDKDGDLRRIINVLDDIKQTDTLQNIHEEYTLNFMYCTTTVRSDMMILLLEDSAEAYIVSEITYRNFITPKPYEAQVSKSFSELNRVDVVKEVFSILRIWREGDTFGPIIGDSRKMNTQMQGSYGEAITVANHFFLKDIRSINLWSIQYGKSSLFHQRLWKYLTHFDDLFPERSIYVNRNMTHFPDFVTVGMNTGNPSGGIVRMLAQEVKATFNNSIGAHDKMKFQNDASAMLSEAYEYGISLGIPDKVKISIGIINVVQSHMNQTILLPNGFCNEMSLGAKDAIKFHNYCAFIMSPLNPHPCSSDSAFNRIIFEGALERKTIEFNNSLIVQDAPVKSGTSMENIMYSILWFESITRRDNISNIILTNMYEQYKWVYSKNIITAVRVIIEVFAMFPETEYYKWFRERVHTDMPTTSSAA